jgi:hypothetical protein
MKRIIAPLVLVIAVAAAFVPGIRMSAHSAEHKECSVASLDGSFGFTSTGTLLALPAPLAGPFGEVGRQTFDGQGNTDATATISLNGNIKQLTIQGTYVVNADCTGSMTVLISPLGVTGHLDFVIDDDEAEVRAIATGPGTIETRVYRKQFERGHKGD